MKPTSAHPPVLDDVVAARARIASGVVATACPAAPALQHLVEGTLHLKLEGQQRTGSFKDRGALNRLLALTPEQRTRGVVTASAGNHAQALAWHGGRLGIPVTVVMPATAPLVKVANARGYGARVLQAGSILDESAVEARRLATEEGRLFVSAFDDPDVIAGQGTIGLEILEQVPDIDTLIVPIGGGGLISGIGVAVKERLPGVRLIGVEAEAAASALASRRVGRVVPISHADTLADGIAVKRVGDLTFPLIERYVDDIVTVTEEEIASAILLLLERQRAVVEGAGAVGVAALSAGRIPTRAGGQTVAVLSGGNIDVNRIARIIERGLVADGRMAHLMVKVPDRPGSLARVADLVARSGANVMDIHHRRGFADIRVGDVEIVVHAETRGREHVAQIVATLTAAGLQVEQDL